jgi:hypothetical protein
MRELLLQTESDAKASLETESDAKASLLNQELCESFSQKSVKNSHLVRTVCVYHPPVKTW